MFPSGSTATCVGRLGSRGVRGLSSSSSAGWVGAVVAGVAAGRRSHAEHAPKIASRIGTRTLMRANVSQAARGTSSATACEQEHGEQREDRRRLGDGADVLKTRE